MLCRASSRSVMTVVNCFFLLPVSHSVKLFSLAESSLLDAPAFIPLYLQRKGDIRRLSIAEKTLLLLEFLDLVFFGRLGNQLVDVAQGPFRRNIKSSILLANTVATKMPYSKSVRCDFELVAHPPFHLSASSPDSTAETWLHYRALNTVASVGSHLTEIDSRDGTDGTARECASRVCIVVFARTSHTGVRMYTNQNLGTWAKRPVVHMQHWSASI